jgi:hypothetical protein
VISQDYGGGSNSGAVLAKDYVELFNRGTAPVTLDQKSVQYHSDNGNEAWQKVNLDNVSLDPGQYFLLQLGIAECHAGEMIEVERAVDGCKRGRGHPVHPLQFRHHGAGPGIARCPPIRRSSSLHPSTEMVNEMFRTFGANPPVY